MDVGVCVVCVLEGKSRSMWKQPDRHLPVFVVVVCALCTRQAT